MIQTRHSRIGIAWFVTTCIGLTAHRKHAFHRHTMIAAYSIALGLCVSLTALVALTLCAWQRRGRSPTQSAPPLPTTQTSNSARMEPAFSNISVGISSLGSIRTDGWMISSSELELGARLGAGSYGEVVRGQWRGTEVAVKSYHERDLMNVDSAARWEFESEVQMLSSMRDPNILNFLGAVVEDNKCFIVTELMPRGSLYYVLNKHSIEIDPRRRLRMALDVARGMNELHCHKIVHRDLKSPK